jgi:glycosyltransferase involved in cell wall biosynthesis
MSSSAKRVSVIGTVGIPARYGGFETLAEQLVAHLSDRFDFTVYCSGPAYRQRPSVYQKARLKFLPLHANGVQSTPYDVLAMAHAITRKAEVLLVLGVSGALAIPLVRRLSRTTRIVVNIDGLEWRREKWGPLARWFLRMSEGAAIRGADVVIADNEVIAHYVRDRYGVTPALVEYGADHVRPETRDEGLMRAMGIAHADYALTVCRIEPENNVHLILESFREARGLPVVIVGNWDHSAYGRHLRSKYSGGSHTVLADPIYDGRRLNMLRANCSLYVHGHSAGGTNPSLIEAMQLRRAIAAFDVSYNRVTTDGRAAYFRTSAELSGIVCGMGEAERRRMGETLADIAARRYTWRRIAEEYERLFVGDLKTASTDVPALGPEAQEHRCR